MFNNYFKIIPILCLATLLLACGNENRQLVYVDTDIADEEFTEYNENVIRIPYRSENGVKFVNVTVNGVGLEMIFDTGCSGTLISAAEANYLYQKGKLTAEDIRGMAQSQIADGSFVENMVINLKEVIIDNQVLCPDVTATVVNNINAPLLLGNEILDRFPAIEIDTNDETLIFKTK